MNKSVPGGVASKSVENHKQKTKVLRKKISRRKVKIQPTDESTLCAYDKLRLDNIKEREEIMIMLGFLAVKEKKLKEKKIIKIKRDEVTVLRRSARLSSIADL